MARPFSTRMRSTEVSRRISPPAPPSAAPLAREAFLEAAPELLAALGDVEPLRADAQVVVAVGIQLAELHVARDAKAFVDGAHPAARAQFADVVDAGAEAVFLQGEGMA